MAVYESLRRIGMGITLGASAYRSEFGIRCHASAESNLKLLLGGRYAITQLDPQVYSFILFQHLTLQWLSCDCTLSSYQLLYRRVMQRNLPQQPWLLIYIPFFLQLIEGKATNRISPYGCYDYSSSICTFGTYPRTVVYPQGNISFSRDQSSVKVVSIRGRQCRLEGFPVGYVPYIRLAKHLSSYSDEVKSFVIDCIDTYEAVYE